MNPGNLSFLRVSALAEYVKTLARYLSEADPFPERVAELAHSLVAGPMEQRYSRASAIQESDHRRLLQHESSLIIEIERARRELHRDPRIGPREVIALHDAALRQALEVL